MVIVDGKATPAFAFHNDPIYSWQLAIEVNAAALFFDVCLCTTRHNHFGEGSLFALDSAMPIFDFFGKVPRYP